MSATGMSKVRRYEGRRYTSPDQRLVNYLESRIIEAYLDELCRPGDSVLDMPCGYGRFVPTLRERFGTLVCADRNWAMLTRTQERFRQRTVSVQLVSDRLPFVNNSFDAITCIRLLQHLHADDQRLNTFAEIGRIARRGAVITVYQDSGLHGLIHRARRLKRLTCDRMKHLEHQLDQCGLRIRRSARILPGLHAQTILLLERVVIPD